MLFLKVEEMTECTYYYVTVKGNKLMNFKLIEVEINEKDFPDQKEFAIYITKNEMLKIKEKTKTNEYKLAIKLKKKYRVSVNEDHNYFVNAIEGFIFSTDEEEFFDEVTTTMMKRLDIQKGQNK